MKYLIIVCILFGIIRSSSGLSAQESIPDSLIDIKLARYIAETNPDKALRIVELVRQQKKAPEYQIDWVTTQIYGKKGQERMAIEMAKRTLANDSVRNNPQFYFNMCVNMVESMIYIEDYEQAMYYAEEMVRQIDKKGASNNNKHHPFWVIARIYRATGDKEKAYTWLNEAIGLIQQKIDSLQTEKMVTAKNYQTQAKYYSDLSHWQAEDGDLNAAIRSALKQYETITKLEPIKDGPYPWKIPLNALDKEYCMAYGNIACLYAKSGDAAKGQQWFDKLLNNPQHETLIAQELMISYYQIKKDFQKVIALAMPYASFLKDGDSINSVRRSTFLNLAEAYKQLRQPEQALFYTQKAMEQTDSLNQRKQRSNALEMATIYDTQEKEKQIQKQDAELHTHRILSVAAIGTILLLGIILWLIWQNLRTTRRKNRLMVMQIDSLLSYKDELNLAKEEIHKLTQSIEAESTKEKEETGTSGDIPKDNTPASYTEEDKTMFEELDRILTKERLFLDPELSRDSIIRRTHINKNRIASLIQTFTGTNFNGYINNMRLEYSILLLKDYTNYTIPAVAADSGFNNVRTFYRLFREKYGMTPTEYRQIVLEM
ncbi:helix-turn-helix domain-containing protein [uncultured Parabacteroides sp.]|uniref:helix-turn-helix domain-containing protein n=1 Tax=uncultured Parabacteroides sp. TaxID=512312 RepID=UPI0025F381E0|nr:helix-turn-helix domain-containing protein [uncultured Parabacteroides sp.]